MLRRLDSEKGRKRLLQREVFLSLTLGYNLLITGVYWGYNPLTNHLLSFWDIQVTLVFEVVFFEVVLIPPHVWCFWKGNISSNWPSLQTNSYMHPTRKQISIADYEYLNCPIEDPGMENMVCRFKNLSHRFRRHGYNQFHSSPDAPWDGSILSKPFPLFHVAIFHRSCSQIIHTWTGASG